MGNKKIRGDTEKSQILDVTHLTHKHIGVVCRKLKVFHHVCLQQAKHN